MSNAASSDIPFPLADVAVSPVIAVTDLDHARAFYEGRLGLRGESVPGGGWVVHAGDGTLITLLEGIPSAGSADWPVATFRVDDVHATVRTLRAADVSFLGPDDVPFDLDADGVSTGDDGLSIAWMRDPDGSTLTVYSVSAAAAEDSSSPVPPAVGMFSFFSPDPRRLARFWAELMGLPVADGATDDLVMLDLDHVVGDVTWIIQHGDAPTGGGIGLDISQQGSDYAATADAAEALGARRIAEHEQNGTRWIEMTDPDGNPFRVFNPFRV